MIFIYTFSIFIFHFYVFFYILFAKSYFAFYIHCKFRFLNLISTFVYFIFVFHFYKKENKKKPKVKVCSPDGDTDYFNIIAGVLQGDTLAPYLFIICLDYMLRMSINLMKENGLKQVKKRSRRYPAQTITDMDYTDDIALLANSPTQAESLLHSLEWVAGSIGLHVNAD